MGIQIEYIELYSAFVLHKSLWYYYCISNPTSNYLSKSIMKNYKIGMLLEWNIRKRNDWTLLETKTKNIWYIIWCSEAALFPFLLSCVLLQEMMNDLKIYKLLNKMLSGQDFETKKIKILCFWYNDMPSERTCSKFI